MSFASNLTFVYDDYNREVAVFYLPDEPGAEKILLGITSSAEAQTSKALYAWAKTRMQLLGIPFPDFQVNVQMGVAVIRPVNAVTLFGGKE